MISKIRIYFTWNNITNWSNQWQFWKNHFMLGIFVDLSKTFYTVDYIILVKKLKLYRVKENNLRWFESYLGTRKQCISYSSNKCTTFESMVPYCSILGPLLFLMYINDFPNTSNILDPIMFAGDTIFLLALRYQNTFFYSKWRPIKAWRLIYSK